MLVHQQTLNNSGDFIMMLIHLIINSLKFWACCSSIAQEIRYLAAITTPSCLWGTHCKNLIHSNIILISSHLAKCNSLKVNANIHKL